MVFTLNSTYTLASMISCCLISLAAPLMLLICNQTWMLSLLLDPPVWLVMESLNPWKSKIPPALDKKTPFLNPSDTKQFCHHWIFLYHACKYFGVILSRSLSCTVLSWASLPACALRLGPIHRQLHSADQHLQQSVALQVLGFTNATVLLSDLHQASSHLINIKYTWGSSVLCCVSCHSQTPLTIPWMVFPTTETKTGDWTLLSHVYSWWSHVYVYTSQSLPNLRYACPLWGTKGTHLYIGLTHTYITLSLPVLYHHRTPFLKATSLHAHIVFKRD